MVTEKNIHGNNVGEFHYFGSLNLLYYFITKDKHYKMFPCEIYLIVE